MVESFSSVLSRLTVGEHLCGLYETDEEHRSQLTPFLRQGLARNERVVYLASRYTAEDITRYLAVSGVDVDARLASDQLQVLRAEEVYVSDGGVSPHEIIAFLGEQTEQALAAGYEALRIAGETQPLQDLSEPALVIEYETRLNRFVPQHKFVGLCQYDRRRCDPELLLEILSAHPSVVVGPHVYDNVYYVPPGTRYRDDHGAVLEHRLKTLANRSAQLLEAERMAHEEAETLREATAAIASPLDIQSVLEEIMIQLDRAIGYKSACVFLLEEDRVRAVAGRNLPYPDHVIGRTFAASNALLQELQRTRKPLVLFDAKADSRFEGWGGTGDVYGWMGIPLWIRDEVIGYLTLDSGTVGAYGDAEASLALAFANHAAVALEHARLFEAERTAREHAETLRAASVALTESLELDVVMETLLDYLQNLIPYDSASVMLREDETRLVIRAHRGYDASAHPDELSGRIFELEHYRNLRDLITSHESTIIANTDEYPHWDRHCPEARHIASWMGVPMVAGGEVKGVFSVDKGKPAFFTEKHRRAAEALAGQAAIAIQNAQLFAEVHAGRERLQDLSQRLVEVQEDERHTIARELHDEIGQILTGLKLTLEMNQHDGVDTANEWLDRAMHLVDDLIGKVRDLSLDLRPAMLDDLGLLPALLWHFQRFRAQTGIDVEFQHSHIDRRFSSAIETTVYRVAQEALTNVARHTNVREVKVRVWAENQHICVKVEDEGAGFDVEAVRNHRMTGGVAGMRERVNLVGGQLTIESAPEAGTSLLAELPLGQSHVERRDQEREP